MILTHDYLRGFYDGVTHKDTPAADACRQVEKTKDANAVTYFAIKSAKELSRYCRERGAACKDCPFSVDRVDAICALQGIPVNWVIETEGEK